MRTDNIIAGDGPAPKRFVIIAFDSLAKAKAWDASAAQQEVTAIRLKSTKSRQFLVEGMRDKEAVFLASLEAASTGGFLHLKGQARQFLRSGNFGRELELSAQNSCATFSFNA
jgi:hypothetical protein